MTLNSEMVTVSKSGGCCNFTTDWNSMSMNGNFKRRYTMSALMQTLQWAFSIKFRLFLGKTIQCNSTKKIPEKLIQFQSAL